MRKIARLFSLVIKMWLHILGAKDKLSYCIENSGKILFKIVLIYYFLKAVGRSTAQLISGYIKKGTSSFSGLQ